LSFGACFLEFMAGQFTAVAIKIYQSFTMEINFEG
jgi:hypothetical protein